MSPVVDGLREAALSTRARRTVDVLLVICALGVLLLFCHYALRVEYTYGSLAQGMRPFTLATVCGYGPILVLVGAVAIAGCLRRGARELTGTIVLTLAAAAVSAWTFAFDASGTSYDESIFYDTLYLFAFGCALLATLAIATTGVVLASYRRQRRRDHGLPASLGDYALSAARRRLLSIANGAVACVLAIAGLANFLAAHYEPDSGDAPHSLLHDTGGLLVIAVVLTLVFLVALASARRYLFDIGIGVLAMISAITNLVLWVIFARIGPHLFGRVESLVGRVESLVGEIGFVVAMLVLFVVGIVHTVLVQVLYRRTRRESLPSIPTAIAAKV